MRLALIHSPFVGPSCWRQTADALAASGIEAIAVDYGGVHPPDWYDGVAQRIAAAVPGFEPLTLAVHSGAGGFVPAVANALGPRARGFLFVDAVLPYPGQRWSDTAPPALAGRMREIAEEGVLPPWDTWFGRGAIDALIEDPNLRAAFSADLPHVPLAYLDAIAPAVEAWRGRRTAYLQLSEPYAAEAEAAEALGWIVRRERQHHLAMLTHPDRLAGILAEMADELAA